MGQKYAHYDDAGAIIGFYDSSISAPGADAQVIEITDAEWQTCLSTPGYTVSKSTKDLVAPAAPTAAELLASAKAAKTAALSAACQAQIVAGFTSSALGAPYTYPASLIDQQNLSASVLASLMPSLPATWETPFPCADAAGAWAKRAHTAAQIQQAGADGKAAILAATQKNDALAAEVAAATTVDAVNAITW